MVKKCPKGKVLSPKNRCIDASGAMAKKYHIGKFSSTGNSPTKKVCPKGKVLSPKNRCINKNGAAAKKYALLHKFIFESSSKSSSTPKKKICPKGKVLSPKNRCINENGAAAKKYALLIIKSPNKLSLKIEDKKSSHNSNKMSSKKVSSRREKSKAELVKELCSEMKINLKQTLMGSDVDIHSKEDADKFINNKKGAIKKIAEEMYDDFAKNNELDLIMYDRPGDAVREYLYESKYMKDIPYADGRWYALNKGERWAAIVKEEQEN